MARYRCNICGEEFDTKTGRGKMHVASHGRNLRYALQTGLVTLLEKKPKEEIFYFCNDCLQETRRPPRKCLREKHTVFVELRVAE